MILKIEHQQKEWQIDTVRYHDITVSINKTQNVNCYFLDAPVFEYYDSPQFSGSLAKGGSVNCEKMSYYAHASGTHTECALHVLNVDFDMRSVQIPILNLAVLISIQPAIIGEDKVIDERFFNDFNNVNHAETIIVRTLPNDESKLNANYSDTNPPYFTNEAMKVLQAKGFKHLVTDLPSIDKESDEGLLAAHKAWFTEINQVPKDRTITELVYIDGFIKDGNYFIAFSCPKIETDAVPSCIKLFPVL
jgi:arylformamidase